MTWVFGAMGWAALSSAAAFAADAKVQTVDAEGKNPSDAVELDDVRCRYDGKKLSVVAMGTKTQLLFTIPSFDILPSTTAWKGTVPGTSSDAYFMDTNGSRWRANERSRCDVALDRDEKETRLDVKCWKLVDADTVRPGLQNVVATKLSCANANPAAAR